ncbi:MAG: NTP transferase domain-containing protein [Rickettsiaceae bacterium]|nr:NTP transferase domain-containing protein [Rickettsiaceae bacterium]
MNFIYKNTLLLMSIIIFSVNSFAKSSSNLENRSEKLAVIILAAGNSTRMKSSTSKIFHQISAKPIIKYVLDLAKSLNPEKIIIVTKSDLASALRVIDSTCEIAIQEKPQGTGDAAREAMNKLKKFEGRILVLYGDTPLITKDTIENMLSHLSKSQLVVLGFEGEEGAEYGRLIVNQGGYLERIVEHKDATKEERKIRLYNSGVIAATSSVFHNLLDKITNNNAKGEYYLTDLIELSNKNGFKVLFVPGLSEEVLGVNNREELARVELISQQRMRRKFMLEGVTLVDPDTTFFSFDTKIGKDVTIHPFVILGPCVTIEDNAEIKSFSHIENTHVKSGSVIPHFSIIKN